MPDGVIQWFDATAGEGVVVRNGRRFRAFAADVEPVARRPGVRVHFDIRREQGLERAVEVRLRSGTRAGGHQRRFGTLQGARHPDAKGAPPLARSRADLDRVLGLHPLEIARAWADAVGRGELDVALSLYSPAAVVHLPDADLTGRGRLGSWLVDSPPFGSGRRADVRGSAGEIELSWAARDLAGGRAVGVRCRVEHGWIAEQWLLETPAQPVTSAVEPRPDALRIEWLVSGDVDSQAVSYAYERLAEVAELVDEPILHARVSLASSADPARTRPALARATLDVNGDPVRAHVAAGSMPEAIDLLQRRLRDRIEHRAEHRRARRTLNGLAESGEWRHGDLPTERPEHFDRPADERQLVRLKTLFTEELTADEAIFDMDQLDYDFYLFRDLASGADSVVERVDGSYLLTRLDPGAAELGPTMYPVALSPRSTPILGVDEAIERLNLTGDPFVFFRNIATGRGNVCYRRYDGHYGLIAPD
ncbi:MAG TPA: sigma 54 modulation/S30EA ribosomal C-terminal domain-containing protein [Acidimicrobiales bacterium]|nr:sigma 54 modulation/S30EA ribosomal C-terminal domain-containing protein [Acidimicrobiales bacterium]